MKKRVKVLALFLAIAVALTGAGYAAWGSRITANTTLNSGTWDVQLENNHCGDIYAGDEVNFFKKSNSSMISSMTKRDIQRYDEVNSSYISGAKDVESTNYVYTIDPTINSCRNVATFAFYNLHPGTKAITSYEIRNKGSIPAKIRNIAVKCTDANGKAIAAGSDLDKLYRAIEVSGTVTKHVSDLSFNNVVKTIPAGTKLTDFEGVINGLLSRDDYQLQPITDKYSFFLDSDEMEINNLTFTIPINALNGKEGSKSNLKVSMEYDFVQYNVMVQQ